MMNAVEVPIRAVTVLEDRALVTRNGTQELSAGSHRWVIEGVAPTVVDKTLVVRLGDAARVVQARVVRVPSTTRASQDAKVAEWMAIEQARVQDLEDARQRHALATEAVASLAEIERLNLAELSEDVALGRDVTTRMETLASIRTRKAEALDHVVECARASARAARARRDAQRMLGEIGDEERTIDARIELQVHVETAGVIDIEVRYAVGGAMWRPAHVATLHEDGRLHLESRACVWQATGEPWTDVHLSFSTERPSLGSTPPRLETDMLQTRPKRQQVQVQTRDQVIATTGEGAAEVRDEMPGVDDGGEPLALESSGESTIASNGRPHHVPLFAFESEAERELVCRPEKVEAVLLRTTAAHRGEHPLLAGPVELRRHGGFVGRTSTLFVAPGETFELGWGPEPDLRVHRKVEYGEETRRALSSWVRKPRTITLTLSNLGPSPHTVQLGERIMVSEVEKVEVEHGELGGARVDADGILSKALDVRGFGETTFAFDWTLVVHDDVRGL